MEQKRKIFRLFRHEHGATRRYHDFYATKADEVAKDGDGRNSPFTESLKKHLKTPGKDAEAIFRSVTLDVIQSTGGKQSPWKEGNILGDFYFADSGAAVIERPQPQPEKTTLTVTCSVSSASVWINGQDYGQAREFTITSPGTYTVKVSADGYQPYQTTVDMKLGRSQEVKVFLDRIAAAQPVQPIPPAKPQKQITNSIDQTFVYIEPGTFTMGSPENEPERDDDETQHQVTLTKGFYMQTTEVTQGQWKAVMGNNPSKFSNCGDNCPVEQVSWDDVQEFIRKLNQKEETHAYRLPTEAEWEYAARAGTTTAFAFGNCLSTDQANYDGNYPLSGCSKGKYREGTVPVDSFSPNAWGLYNMHGNVYEWCQDWYGDYPTGAVTDPIGPSSGSSRVVRGGSWSNLARGCRSAGRDCFAPGNRYSNVGFRLSRTP